MLNEKYLVIYADEVIFSAATRQGKAWSNTMMNIEYKDKRTYMPAQALVGGITKEYGLVAWHLVK